MRFQVQLLGKAVSLPGGLFVGVYARHGPGREGEGGVALQRKKGGVHVVSRGMGECASRTKVCSWRCDMFMHAEAFRESLAKAVALPAVELCQSLW